ncbi:uncharacterized protein DS421_13g442880 [Arachis hypogaea]|nr:uncharacterized protein DS421_13g442880 [Arachis hypogaea]
MLDEILAEIMQETVARPSKLKVVKGRARGNTSPQVVATSTASLSAETIRGISSAIAKRLTIYFLLKSDFCFQTPHSPCNIYFSLIMIALYFCISFYISISSIIFIFIHPLEEVAMIVLL